MTYTFEEVTILDKPALFTGARIDHNTVPSEYHVYEVRHDDDCKGDAVQLAKYIIINHWGTLITRDEIIDVTRDGYMYIEPNALNYGTGDCRTMSDFMERYPPYITPTLKFEVQQYEISKYSGAVNYDGYTLTEYISVGKKMFIKGENQGAESPFITVQYKRGSLDFCRERYFKENDAALDDIQHRASIEHERLSLTTQKIQKSRDTAR